MYETISETVAAYEDMLNASYAPAGVAGLTFDAAHILRDLDPIAYECGWLDWCDSEGIDTDELEDDYTFN